MKAFQSPERRAGDQSTARPRRRNAARGVALVTTLLILMLLMAMTLAMTISVTSDTLINKYYRNARASFYAADSGVNIARQYMISQISNSVTIGAAAAGAPIPAGETATALANTLAQYTSATSIRGGLAANSWPSSFQIEATYTGTRGTTLGSTVSGWTPCTGVTYTGTATNSGPYTCVSPPTSAAACGTGTGVCITNYQYTYPYTITAIGQSLANEEQIVVDAGNITVNVGIGQNGTKAQSFAGWGMFIDQFPECTDGDLVGGTLTGPVFTNGAWTFASGSSYTFTGTIGSVSPTFGYDFGGNCYGSAAQSYKSGGSTIAPAFQSGVNLGANAVPLPANSFNQKEAVVDGLGNSWTSYTASQQDAAMNAVLKTVDGNSTPYPVAGTTNAGVYMSYSQTTPPAAPSNNMVGGGIYVEGSVTSVVLTAATSGDASEIYTITQGSTVTTITVDATSNMTTVASKVGSTTKTTVISGVPENLSGPVVSPATMLYVDGNIGSGSNNTGLSGPENSGGTSSTGPAIENGAAITVTSAGAINVTGDIDYQTEPVTTVSNQAISSTLTNPTACCSGDPVDTLIPYNAAHPDTSVLGIFTASGNVTLDNQQSSGNMEIDASIATISSGGSGGLTNPGNAINQLTIVGGRIQNTIQDINTSTRNVFFDQRFASGGFAPPWFPSTTITQTAAASVSSVLPTFQRTQWLAMF
jgi:Tfp pilus assembly protein PilX